MSAAPSARSPRAPRAAAMSIGSVVEQLRAEFSDVTLSKVRYLESEGLISPERSASGYRRFYDADVERLRFILSAQRDHYLPLKVIRAQLAERDGQGEQVSAEASVSPLPGISLVPPVVAEPEPEDRSRLSLSEVAVAAGVDEQFITQLRREALLAVDASGYFSADAVALVGRADTLRQAGVGLRALRGFLPAANREAGIIEQVVTHGHPAGGMSEAARQHAAELAATLVDFHAHLLRQQYLAGQ